MEIKISRVRPCNKLIFNDIITKTPQKIRFSSPQRLREAHGKKIFSIKSIRKLEPICSRHFSLKKNKPSLQRTSIHRYLTPLTFQKQSSGLYNTLKP